MRTIVAIFAALIPLAALPAATRAQHWPTHPLIMVGPFAPGALVTDQSLVLVARRDFPADTLQDFIAYAKKNQRNLQYGSAGAGGSNHLACVLLNSVIGIDVTHVPYRCGGQAMQDLIAGRL